MLLEMLDKEIKILFVEPISDLGGVSQYILSISRYLPRMKYDIHVAAFGDGPLFELLRHDNISTHSLKMDYSLFSFLQAVFSFRRFLQRERFDIIHAHTAKAGFLCCIANKGLPSEIIYTGHGFRFDQKENYLIKILFFWFERFIWHSSRYITVLSKTEYDFGISKGLLDCNKASVVSMSIDLNRFKSIILEDVERQKIKIGIPADAFVVGMLGRITFQKDPETFIKAAEILNSHMQNIYFLWVGDGDLKEKMVGMANRLGLSNKVIITGQQDSKDIPTLLSVMDVLLFTSRFEGLPIALLEAMAVKKLIVAANVGSVQDVIKNDSTGWLFDAGDYRKAASLVENIYVNTRELEEIGIAAFNLIVDRYSPKEKMSMQFQNIYENILKSR
jgi:glycosyltransferase involved in cell wall biosynthesis